MTLLNLLASGGSSVLSSREIFGDLKVLVKEVLKSFDLKMGWKLDLHQIAFPDLAAALSVHDAQSRLFKDHTAYLGQHCAGELYTC